MIRRAAPFLFVAAAAAAPLAAQRTLAELQQQFAAQARQLDPRGPATARDELLAQQARTLQQFVDTGAAGDDRWNGRLMLADLQLSRGKRDEATAALRGIDAGEAPALVLVTAATMAQHVPAKDLRDRFVAAALAKPATPLADRLAMARLLTRVLHEPQRGEQVFADALAGATDDEQRALVRWHRADTLRDREDLPENAAFDAFEELTKELPNTYWGGIARDQLRATTLRPGEPAIEFRAPLRGGGEFTLAANRGKVVVLAFWSLADRDTPALVTLLRQLSRRHGERIAVLGIALDRDVAAIDGAVRELGIDFPVTADGKGAATDPALRWFVGSPAVVVIGPDGNVVRLGMHAGTADSRAEIEAAVDGAVTK